MYMQTFNLIQNLELRLIPGSLKQINSISMEIFLTHPDNISKNNLLQQVIPLTSNPPSKPGAQALHPLAMPAAQSSL